jgi:hypothetical protein
MSEPASREELFAPSLRGVRRGPLEEGSRPWRLGSQLYVGFFGGALAVAAIAWVNAERLGVPAARRRLIVLIGAAGVAGTIAAALVAGTDVGNTIRLVARVGGVATFGLLFLVQRPFDRVYHSFTEGDEDQIYDALWVPGLAATFGLGIVQAVLTAIVVGTF